MIFVILLMAGALSYGQGITLESVSGLVGPAEDSMLAADGSTQIVFNLRLVGLNTVSGGFTTGFRVYSPDGAVWGSLTADTLTVGTGWDAMWDSPGGFFKNYCSADGSGADTVGLGALAIFGGLPADFDEVAYALTIGPIGPEHDGRTLVLDSSFYPPNGHWMMAGAGGSFSWGGPYNFTLANPLSVNGDGSQLPTQFALGQNYPNPFNPTTEIRFDLPSRSHVNLSVYNLLGQRVRQLLDEERRAGSWIVSWNGSDDNGNAVSSGVYFFKMEAGNFTDTRKMMLLK